MPRYSIPLRLAIGILVQFDWTENSMRGSTIRRSQTLSAALAAIGWVIGLTLAPPVWAQSQEWSLTAGPPAVVVEVVDGDTVRIDDGRQIRLTGIQAPKLPLGRAGFRAWPLAEPARAAMEALSLGKKVRLGFGGRREDRHGRILAHVFTADGAWLQGEMVSRGLARVYSFADNRACVAALLAREREARDADRGIWALDWYAIRPAGPDVGPYGSFQLVEGTVRKVAVVRGRLYLNFGEDWRTDFTVTAAPKVRARLDREGYDYAGLEGRRIRVRGWIDERNGPMLNLSHGEQIERLDRPPPPAVDCALP